MTATLHLVTMPRTDEPDPCKDTYTCSCLRCVIVKLALVDRGVQAAKPQPWEPRLAA